MSSDKTAPKEWRPDATVPDDKPAPLIEDLDYYLENGLLVFTAHYLSKRGYCCENGCRHCPYGFQNRSFSL